MTKEGSMRRAFVLACILVLSLAVPVTAKGSPASVRGLYTYWFDWGGRLNSVAATDEANTRGVWSWTQLLLGGGTYTTLVGAVTCLAVDGHDAWAAGPAVLSLGVKPPNPAREYGAFLWIHDSGLPGGTGDMAMTWISDIGVTTPADMETLCRHRMTSFTKPELDAIGVPWSPEIEANLYLMPLTNGNVVVRDGS
jgi:hypothetical protein